MKNILLLSLLLASIPAWSADPTTISSSDDLSQEKVFNHRKSHWVANFGFENTKYKAPFDYQATQRNFKEEERNLMGGRLGFGYEAYIGGGFILGGGISGYYMGTAFLNEKIASNAAGAKIGAENDTGQVWGGDAIGHLGWMFDYKTKNPFLGEMTYMAMELFAEVGIGKGQAYLRKDYYYDTNTSGTYEKYDAIITDNFTSTSVAAGVNFLSTTTGYFLNLKVSQVFLNIDERKTRVSATNGTTNTVAGTQKDPDIDPITVFTLGGGYKF